MMPALLAIGLFLNSALYFIFVFTAALVLGRYQAMVTVIIATGITYLSYYAQLSMILTQSKLPRMMAGILVLLSIVTGAAAGLMLLV